MVNSNDDECDRRQFATALTGIVASSFAAPAIATESKTDSQIILGDGDYKYAVQHNWAQLPQEFEWQTTHNCTIDRNGFVYIIHEGLENRRDHPTIFVFDTVGKYVRSFGNQFAGGAHGMDLRDENGEEFLYVASYRPKMFAKLSLNGEEVWRRYAPMNSGKYALGEEVDNHVYNQRDTFMPTNFAFLPEGDFLVADGYGSYLVHRYDKDANWKSCFGGAGEDDDSFFCPHGLKYDDRPGREPVVLVTDRARHIVKSFSIGGEYQGTLDGFLAPCNFDIRGEDIVVPDLNSRITILNSKNEVLTHLAYDVAWQQEVDQKQLRTKPETWRAGRFVHPHDACFDHEGNIIVTEWVQPGRVTKLSLLS